MTDFEATDVACMRGDVLVDESDGREAASFNEIIGRLPMSLQGGQLTNALATSLAPMQKQYTNPNIPPVIAIQRYWSEFVDIMQLFIFDEAWFQLV